MRRRRRVNARDAIAPSDAYANCASAATWGCRLQILPQAKERNLRTPEQQSPRTSEARAPPMWTDALKPPHFFRPPFVVIGRHRNRKSVRHCDSIQKNPKRCKNLTESCSARGSDNLQRRRVPPQPASRAVTARLSLAGKRLILRFG